VPTPPRLLKFKMPIRHRRSPTGQLIRRHHRHRCRSIRYLTSCTKRCTPVVADIYVTGSTHPTAHELQSGGRRRPPRPGGSSYFLTDYNVVQFSPMSYQHHRVRRSGSDAIRQLGIATRWSPSSTATARSWHRVQEYTASPHRFPTSTSHHHSESAGTCRRGIADQHGGILHGPRHHRPDRNARRRRSRLAVRMFYGTRWASVHDVGFVGHLRHTPPRAETSPRRAIDLHGSPLRA